MTNHFFVLNISRTAAQSGLSDHIKVKLPIKIVISVSECPRSLNIVADTHVTMIKGIPSAK